MAARMDKSKVAGSDGPGRGSQRRAEATLGRLSHDEGSRSQPKSSQTNGAMHRYAVLVVMR